MWAAPLAARPVADGDTKKHGAEPTPDTRRLTDVWRQLLDRAHSLPSSIGVSGIGLPSRAASFFLDIDDEFGVFQPLLQASVSTTLEF